MPLHTVATRPENVIVFARENAIGHSITLRPLIGADTHVALPTKLYTAIPIAPVTLDPATHCPPPTAPGRDRDEEVEGTAGEFARGPAFRGGEAARGTVQAPAGTSRRDSFGRTNQSPRRRVSRAVYRLREMSGS